jgi:hypothetical protein
LVFGSLTGDRIPDLKIQVDRNHSLVIKPVFAELAEYKNAPGYAPLFS